MSRSQTPMKQGLITSAQATNWFSHKQAPGWIEPAGMRVGVGMVMKFNHKCPSPPLQQRQGI